MGGVEIHTKSQHKTGFLVEPWIILAQFFETMHQCVLVQVRSWFISLLLPFECRKCRPESQLLFRGEVLLDLV